MPISTYRLQLTPTFTLTSAADVAAYLAELGVTDCYCSPVFTAKRGSTHGYDICSHTDINPELGGEAAFDALSTRLSALGLGLILDFVPNHMSNDPHTNEWWRDVLENGPSSPYAEFFDIDWDPVKPELRERLLLPILAEPYGEALENGRLQLRFVEGRLVLEYGELVIPINPRRSPIVFELNLPALEATMGEDDPRLREFLSVLTALRNLPPYTERDRRRILERQREKEVARERLQRLVQESDAVRAHIAATVTAFNGTPGDSASFDRLHGLLELQAYRLASWRTAADEINYRRFFDINELAGIRVEHPRVFEQIHRLVLRLVRERKITGLRLDHIDGLFDPAAYLAQLQDAIRRAQWETDRVDGENGRGEFYVVVEKILSGRETLPAGWPVAGTTGYEFLNELNGIFVCSGNAGRMRRIYTRFAREVASFSDVAYDGKRLIVTSALSSEFQVLAQAVNRLSERDWWSRDFTLASIRRALREVVSCFPVYRSYVSSAGVSASDVGFVDTAIREARRRNPAMESSIFDFLRGILIPGSGTWPRVVSTPSTDAQRLDVAMRFQQYTAPVQAKGVEDTAFYRYHVLASLNEVGGDPIRFGRRVDDFHAANAARRASRPRSMLATTTHDTKRSEDARARLNVLSEIPDEWQGAVARWRRLTARTRIQVDGEQVPDGNDEYLFYQTLVSTWPPEPRDTPLPERAPDELTARVAGFMIKAIREAKVHTSWINENRGYEEGVTAFVRHTLQGPVAQDFLESFVPFVRKVARLGMANSLAQLALKLVAPGVVDFYQGTEFWDFSLVDPDNRRPVDYAARRTALRELEPWLELTAVDAEPDEGNPALVSAVAGLLDHWPDGRIKLFVTACGLRARRARPALFLEGDYVPLTPSGSFADHLVACARHLESAVLVAIAPRLTAGLPEHLPGAPIGDVWGGTAVLLPAEWAGRRFRSLLTGERITPGSLEGGGLALAVRRTLRTCPIALLWSPSP